MHLGQDAGFFVQTVNETYGGEIAFQFMSDKELDRIIQRGMKIYRQLNPKDEGFLSKFGGVIALAAAAAAIYFTAGAAAPAVATAGSAGGTAAASAAGAAGASAAGAAGVAASGAGAAAAGSTAGAWAAIKTAAGYAAKAIPFVGAVTGDPKKAKKAKDVIDVVEKSEGFTDAASSIAEFLVGEHGAEIKTDEAKAALRERIRREQERLAAQIRARYEQELAHRRKVQQQVQAVPFNPLVLAIPAAFILMANA